MFSVLALLVDGCCSLAVLVRAIKLGHQSFCKSIHLLVKVSAVSSAIQKALAL
jgi:hypothetical protein